MKTTFYSHGKLLLTGEYLVLDGAEALAIPTKKGQSLSVTPNDSQQLVWKSYDCHDEIWYETQIAVSELLQENAPKGNTPVDETLFKILWEAQQLSPEGLDENKGYLVETHLEFERLWGLGTSSTLIHNIASWFEVNPFVLLERSFGGSGYDIAAAGADTPILFQKTAQTDAPKITALPDFDPPFKEELFFVYLDNKMDSKKAIANYRSRPKTAITETMVRIDALTRKLYTTESLEDFQSAIDEHEHLISEILGVPTIKAQRFPDFTGSIKSLGGWGGDFVLVVKGSKEYFVNKGYQTIVNYTDMTV